MFRKYRNSLKFEWLELQKSFGARFQFNPYVLRFSFTETKLRLRLMLLMGLSALIILWSLLLGGVPRAATWLGLPTLAWGLLVLTASPFLIESALQIWAYRSQLSAYRKQWSVRDEAIETLILYQRFRLDDQWVREPLTAMGRQNDPTFPVFQEGVWYSVSPSVRFAVSIDRPVVVEVLRGEAWVPSEETPGEHWQQLLEFAKRVRGELDALLHEHNRNYARRLAVAES